MTGDTLVTPAHDQVFTHTYTLHYPEHYPREHDPHYAAFEAYRKATRDSAVCQFAAGIADDSMCAGGLELHHSHIEQAMANEIDLELLRHVYPDILDPVAFVNSAVNLQWLCKYHHRGIGGVHILSSADYEASHYIRGLVRS